MSMDNMSHTVLGLFNNPSKFAASLVLCVGLWTSWSLLIIVRLLGNQQNLIEQWKCTTFVEIESIRYIQYLKHNTCFSFYQISAKNFYAGFQVFFNEFFCVDAYKKRGRKLHSKPKDICTETPALQSKTTHCWEMVGFVSSRTQVQKNNTFKLRYLYPWDAGGVGKVLIKYCTKYKKQHRQSCSSERHENIHTPIPLHTNTHKAFHIQYSPYLQLPCPPKTTSTTHRHTNLSWHFSFSHGHTLCCCPTDANLILGYPSHQAVTLCSLLTFLLLRWWCIWTGPVVCLWKMVLRTGLG